MKTKLTIRLLGQVTFQLHGQPIKGLPSRATEALLVYLVCHQEPIPRETLAELLWRDRSTKQALTNLRTVLTPLRRQLGDYLKVTRQTLAFDHTADYWLDAAAFEEQLNEMLPLLQATASPAAETLIKLQAALDLGKGDFLAAFALRDGYGFEEWAALTRQRLQRLETAGLKWFVDHCLENGRYALGLSYAERLLSLDAYDEEAQQQMMWLLLRNGQRQAALQQYQNCRRLLADELGVEPEPATFALYERIRHTPFPPPNNLPPQATPFIGRDDELTRLQEILADKAVRLVTVTGFGGIGKTRLSIQAATLLANRFIDGVCFVPLASVANPENLAAAIVEPLVQMQVIQPLQGQKTPEAHLAQQLKSKEMLLVIDNFEHLKDGIAVLTQLLEQTSTIKIVVTSRQRLVSRWEHLLAIGGMAYPAANNGLEWPDYDAVQVFMQAAAQTWPHFNPDQDERDAITKICHLVEGMPLALEMAARWVSVQPCADILREITQNNDFLTTASPDVPRRQRSVRAVFDYSWSGLSASERQLLARLAVFRGGFSLAAAQAVAEATPVSLTALLEKSLIQRVTQAKNGSQPRFMLHELLRQYAAEKSETNQDSVTDRYVTYYLHFLQNKGKLLTGSGTTRALEQITAEIDNIRWAWAWATQHKLFQSIEQSSLSLLAYYRIQGWVQEAETVYATTLQTLEAVAKEKDQQQTLIRLQLARARIGQDLGHYEQVKATLAHIVQFAKAEKNSQFLAEAYVQRGKIGWIQGEYANAAEQLNEALLLLAVESAPLVEADCRRNLGLVELQNGRYDSALSNLETALRLFQEQGNLRGEGHVLNNLAMFHFGRESLIKTLHYLQRAKHVWETINDSLGTGRILTNLCAVNIHLGNYNSAQEALIEAKERVVPTDQKRAIAQLQHNEGVLAARLGLYNRAEFLLQAGLKARRALNAKIDVMITLCELALLYLSWHKPELAALHIDEAVALTKEMGTNTAVIRTQLIHAHVLADSGQWQTAGEMYETARKGQVALDRPKSILESLGGLARVAKESGDRENAARYAHDVWNHLQGTHDLGAFLQPFRLFMNCYQALQMSGPETAVQLLAAARQALHARAASINNKAMRQTFLSRADFQELVSNARLT